MSDTETIELYVCKECGEIFDHFHMSDQHYRKGQNGGGWCPGKTVKRQFIGAWQSFTDELYEEFRAAYFSHSFPAIGGESDRMCRTFAEIAAKRIEASE